MTPSAGHVGHPSADRLEQLLRAGSRQPPGVDDASGSSDEEWRASVPASGDAAAGAARARAARGDADRDTSSAAGRHRSVRVPLLSVPAALRSADLSVGVRAVRGLLVLVVVAALVLGGRWLWTQRAAVASPADRVATSEVSDEERDAAPAGGDEGGVVAAQEGGGGADEAGGEGQAAGNASGEETSGTETQESPAAPADLVVHVAGQVLQPGVVSLPAGSRVVDAVRAAGGVTDEADQSTLNLARQLVDGERVWVGRPGETPPAVAPGPLSQAGGGAVEGSGPGGSGAGGSAGPSAPLDLNSATQADLEELPGIGPVTAGHILAWREEHGRFSTVDELLEVSGIGERTLAQLAPLVTAGG